ncbi:hypothetical protein TIFTF001_016153 [Ficus carica]|uniref:Protein kinase domain-containing protein n=1 Tax=Ficus carica TaxID=3494 RepID=A0AA88DIS6_FICCA|nr:hypothetical protein TIFTF001_016153 [Ficus carica]
MEMEMEMEMENENEKEGEEAKKTRQNRTKPMTVGEYVIKSKIGEGCFSTVWKGQHIVNGEEVVAVKQVYLSRLNRHLRTCLDCELTFLSSVNHPNIVRLFHVFRVRLSFSFIFSFSLGFPVFALPIFFS